MNIDLLVTSRGEAGLVCDQDFQSPVAGVLFDADLRQVTLEHTDHETLDLNIPVEDEISEVLMNAMVIQVGVIVDGQIQDNRLVPLMTLNDPVAPAGQQRPARASNSVTMFERFLKSCAAGQPVHRDDLGNEDVSGSVVGGLNRSVLQFAPHLARQKSLEANNELKMAGPAPHAPGMNMGGGGGRSTPPVRRQGSPPQRQTPPDEQED